MINETNRVRKLLALGWTIESQADGTMFWKSPNDDDEFYPITHTSEVYNLAFPSVTRTKSVEVWMHKKTGAINAVNPYYEGAKHYDEWVKSSNEARFEWEE